MVRAIGHEDHDRVRRQRGERSELFVERTALKRDHGEAGIPYPHQLPHSGWPPAIECRGASDDHDLPRGGLEGERGADGPLSPIFPEEHTRQAGENGGFGKIGLGHIREHHRNAAEEHITMPDRELHGLRAQRQH